jgi:hypothetical protein
MWKISCHAPFKGDIFGIFKILYSTLLHLLPTVSEDNGIEPRTVATLALAVRRYKNLLQRKWGKIYAVC